MRGNVRLKGVPVGPTRRGQVLGPPVGDRVWMLWGDGMTSLCAARALPKVVSAPKPIKSTHSHNCSCHLFAPCGACENCRHFDEPECLNDCQDCDEHEGDL